jgi:hypothetical protein
MQVLGEYQSIVDFSHAMFEPKSWRVHAQEAPVRVEVARMQLHTNMLAVQGHLPQPVSMRLLEYWFIRYYTILVIQMYCRNHVVVTR